MAYKEKMQFEDTYYPPSVSGEDVDLGNKLVGFQYTYDVELGSNSSPFILNIYIDEQLIESHEITNTENNRVVSIDDSLFNNLTFGKHILRIVPGEGTPRIITFKKVVERPPLLPDKPSMQDVADTIEDTANYIDYLCSEGIEGIQKIINTII